ncbi:DUF6308 family protein [Brevibacterium permense]|uniref:DUF6308 family protein n=1 Tax=Brevibacterium permense TaxID=234834 RepID=UPI0034E1C167
MESWDLLPRNRPGESRWGLRPPTTSKSMARKRPHLLPIEDSVFDRVIERGAGLSGDCSGKRFRLRPTTSRRGQRR